MRHRLPPGYSMITMSLFGRDIPLAALSSETMMGLKLLLNGFKSGSPIKIKLQDGRHVLGHIQRKLGNAYIAEVGGKQMIVKKGSRIPPRTTVTVEPTRVEVTK